VDLAVTDFENDGKRELVTVIFTAYARYPRGVLVHSLPDGRPLGRALIGAAIRNSVIDDFDGDGKPEVLVATAATHNGGRAGGFDDSRAHVILFDTWPEVRPVWHRTLSPTAVFSEFAFHDFDGDGRREVLLAMAGTDEGTLELLEPRSWRTIRVRRIPGTTMLPAVLDVDGDGRPEVVVPNPPHDVLLYDDDLELMRRRRLRRTVNGHAGVLPDLDSDGIDEIVLMTEGNSLIVGPWLQPKAMIRGLALQIHALHRDRNLPPAVVVNRNDRVSEQFAIRPNPLYLVWRHGPWAGGTAAAAVFLLLGHAGTRFRRRKHALETIHALAQSDPRGILVMDRRGRILLANATLQAWCGTLRDGRSRTRTIDELAATLPDLVAFCRECLAATPPQPIAASQPLRPGPDAPHVRPHAHPAHTGSRSDPHWVIRLENVASSEQTELHAAWAPLARRIAHDLRNPLTSVLLTLKRMQIEYRDAAPDAAARLDTYNDRVQERVDHLRRLTSNFLKLLGEERLHCEELDLNEVVRGAAMRIQSGLPPDIHIVLRLADALPAFDADREQIESVLENLVANAVNAMPNGGAITISTHVARDLRIRAAEPRDCVQIEVMDTGTGIDPSDIGKLFTPGFSRSEHGSGLGLAIVRKIVNDHGGEVSVESELGAGTAFTIILPVPRLSVSAGDGPAATESPRDATRAAGDHA
jgi:nitrogen-specific signal transduction histidine kinase